MEFDINAELEDSRFDAYAQRLRESLGSLTENPRNDALETAVFARQLEHIYTKTYDVLYPEFKARKFIPLDSSVPSGASSFTYRQFDEVGFAKMVANYADDIPDVTLFGKEFTANCHSMVVGYSYSIQDIRRAQMAGLPLTDQLARIAKRAVEAKIDSIAAFGDSTLGFTGFLNNANVPLVSVITGTWSTATADQIVADLDKLVNSIVIATKGVHMPDTLLLDISSFTLLNSKQRSLASDVTILKWYLANNAFITNIDHWYLLATADAAGTGKRAVCYQRNQDVLGLVIPQEFEQFPPQVKNLSFFVPCHARIGGVKIPYPLAIAYMDGI